MVLVLSGPVHGGKTTFLERRLPLWAGRGLACSGFLSPAVSGPALGAGYDFFEITTGRRRPYLRTEGAAGAERVGPYVFVPETLERARAILRASGGSGLLVVDEVGPLELAGGGLWPELGPALARRTGATLLVAREGIVADLAERLAPIAPVVFDIKDPEVAERLDETLLGKAAPHDRHG
jgi:iron complex transport system ATP-binding protein